MEEKIINCGESIIDQCLLPELQIEIGNDYIPPTYFAEFQKILEITLPQLFDYISSHQTILLNTEYSTIELRCKLLRLLCEQNCAQTDFQVQNQKLLDNLQTLLRRYFLEIVDSQPEVEEKLWTYYKTHLHANKWRRHLGSAFGFLKFLQLQYAERNCKELEKDKCLFILSTSLQFKETHEETFKNLGIALLEILLTKSKKEDIETLNIHNVVYENLTLDIPRVKTPKDVELLWKCLFNCIEFTSFKNNYEWNRIDDLIENTLRRITLVSNGEIHQMLFLVISKLCIIFNADKDRIMPFLNVEKIWLLFDDVENLRSICSKMNSHSSLRWAKKLLDIFALEISFLLKENPIILLQTIHMTYLVSIFSIPLNVLEHHLEKFISNFVPCLINVVRLNKTNEAVKKVSKEFLQTILYQIVDSKSSNMQKYKTSLQMVLANEIFSNI